MGAFKNKLGKFFGNVLGWVKGIFTPKTPATLPDTGPLLETSREEIDGILNVVEGTLPDDIHGVFYVTLPVGSVNSGGLPFPEKTPDGKSNPEYASPIMNGDGMVIKIDFNTPVAPTVKTRLMKTPCYYADEATKYGTEHHKLFGFHNMGITRMSMWLGARNELNTAVQPVKFKGQTHPSMLATYDVGRPYVVDAKSLDLITPIAPAKQWVTGQPAMVPWPFGIIQTSAHPVFDPATQELFTVNYSRNENTKTTQAQTLHHLRYNRESFKTKLEELAKPLVNHPDDDHVKRQANAFFTDLNKHFEGHPYKEEEEPVGDVYSYLMRWDGNSPIQKWSLKDQHGDKLAIYECMHQTGFTQDYIILTDCAFKFSLDLLFDNPFPESKLIEQLIRRLTTTTMEAFTTTYIIHRADILPDAKEITAYRLDKPIPLETIHYSCNYANPDGIITLVGVHNAATCIAEWVRTFDRRATDKRPVDPQYYSLFAVGSMDVSRIGKWKIDAKNNTLLEDESVILEEPGNYDKPNIGPNTWTTVLYTFRDILSSERNVNEIKQFWVTNGGTDDNVLTEFVYNLYKNYPHRKLSLETILEVTKRRLPFGITRVNVETMQLEDYYQCDDRVYVRGVHFVSKKQPTPGVPPELDGYLVSPVQVGKLLPNRKWNFTAQFWIFDAQDIAKGPICKLQNPKIKFAFTLHTAYAEVALQSQQSFKISAREDYDPMIDSIKIGADKKLVQEFFEKNVYPHFEN